MLGTIHNDDAVAMQAQADALTGYNYLAGLAPTATLTGRISEALRSTPVSTSSRRQPG